MTLKTCAVVFVSGKEEWNDKELYFRDFETKEPGLKHYELVKEMEVMFDHGKPLLRVRKLNDIGIMVDTLFEAVPFKVMIECGTESNI